MRKNEINRTPTTILVMGLLSIIIPFIGLLLGVIGIMFAINLSKQTNFQKGKNQSLIFTGKILSIIGIVIQGFLIFSFLIFILYTNIT